jgi:SagB-type dehydrogenase family enzyme
MFEDKKIFVIILIILLGIALFYVIWSNYISNSNEIEPRKVIGVVDLPAPKISGKISVEEAIQQRRSVRSYSNEPLTLQDISQILWAAQGITDPIRNFRAAPSAGHTYPLEIYLIVGKDGITGLSEGLYLYDPLNNILKKFKEEDLRSTLATAADGQPWVEEAPVNIIITGVYQKMINKYKDVDLSIRFVNMEAGHVGENIYLEAVARGLGTVSIGSFHDDQMINILQLPSNETSLYIFPIGHPVS